MYKPALLNSDVAESAKLYQRSERIYINAAVCEGCGDCAKSSNCVALKPKFDGEAYKRVIDQSVCNDDYSCLDGFCPSFVAVVPSVGNARKKLNYQKTLNFQIRLF